MRQLESGVYRERKRVLLTGLEAAKLLVVSLLLVPGGHNRRDVAAGLIVAVGSFHGRHGGGLDTTGRAG
jgi:hypothetical protein